MLWWRPRDRRSLPGTRAYRWYRVARWAGRSSHRTVHRPDQANHRDQNFGTTLFADIHIRHDLFELVVGGLGAHHGVGVQRVALFDLFDPLDGQVVKVIGHALLD